jgi:tryptophan synthase beta chain
MALILQEVSEDAEIAIPEEILDIYSLWRPTPHYRARRLEQEVGTRSRIFYKYDGVSPAGSHKPNAAVAQAHYNQQEGRTRLSLAATVSAANQTTRMRCATSTRHCASPRNIRRSTSKARWARGSSARSMGASSGATRARVH